jgi:hypothetical protein
VWLIERNALDVRAAAVLSLLVEARATTIVVAEPHEAGKTTLLTALLAFLPDTTQRVYLRGWYERFGFLDSVAPHDAYLLCNEISSHLPTYMWGRGVRRLFEAAANGYPLATTMHAIAAASVMEQLVQFPLEVPAEHLNAIDIVVSIGVGYLDNRLVRRVNRIEWLTRDARGQVIDEIARREPLRASIDHRLGREIAAIATLVGIGDDDAAARLARRERLLETWLRDGITDYDDVAAALASSRTQPG